VSAGVTSEGGKFLSAEVTKEGGKFVSAEITTLYVKWTSFFVI
jgi:hypothetical protein